MIILFTVGSLFLLACDSKNKKSKVLKTNNSNLEWKNHFKDLVLCNCVVLGVSDSAVRMKFLITDKSFYDPINIVMEEDIKQALSSVILEMKKDSIISLTTVGEGAQGKTIFNHCLSFYKSHSLDSLSDKKLYKWNHMNIDSAMAIKAPAY